MKGFLSSISRRRVTAAVLAGGVLLTSMLLVSAQQQNNRGARVRGMNSQLLQLHALAQSDARTGVALRAQVAELVQQRRNDLAALIEQDPAEALRVAFPSDVVSDVASSFPGARALLESHGNWEGPIEYSVADSEDFRSHRNIREMSVGGETLTIHFADREPAGLKNGDVLRVSGVRAGNQIAAYNGTTVQGSSANGNRRPPPPRCTTIGPQNSIVLMVTMPGSPLPTDVTQTGVREDFFDTGGTLLSLTDYWREASYGLTTATGQVAPFSGGWYELDQPYSDTQRAEIRAAAIRAADPDVDFTQYSRVFIVINGMPVNETWAGVGTIGCGSLSSNDGNFIASTSWIRATSFVTNVRGAFLAMHEAGHNLGLHHSNSRDFDTGVLGAPGVAGVVEEYSDVFSSMGRGTGHYAASHKARLGWLTSQVLTVTGSGAFALQPTELSAGTVQALKIRRGTDNANWVWVEFRQPFGIYDTRLAAPVIHGQVNYLPAADSGVYTGGILHYEDATTGLYSHLLDMTLQSRSGNTTPIIADDWLDPMLAGTWSDSYTGLTITTSGGSSGTLTVNVTYGSGPCVEAPPTVTLSPPNPSAKRGQTVTYSVTVTNNDTTSCFSKAFTLGSSLPNGWPTSFAQNPITVSAGSSVSVSMTKTIPGDATFATYPVNASATSGGYSATGNASVTVKPGK